ncbi:MAG TPA: hypothetical protein V6C81_28355 [Planktothrix sp.]|jgi:hypothetical protein
MTKSLAVAVFLAFFIAGPSWAQAAHANVAQSAQAPVLPSDQLSAPAPGTDLSDQAADKSLPNDEPAAKGLLKTGTSQNAFQLGTEEKLLAWEKWHARVGRAIGKRIADANGAALGTVLLRITVSRDGVLKAQPLAGGDRMSERAVEAAQSLSFDRILQFPEESKRDMMMFDFQYKRGFFILPKHHYIKDDYERMD